MSNPIRIQIKPAKNGEHTVRIRHGKTTFSSETLKNEGNTKIMIAHLVTEIRAGNYTFEKIADNGKVVHEFVPMDNGTKITF